MSSGVCHSALNMISQRRILPCPQACCGNSPIEAADALPPKHCLDRSEGGHTMQLHGHIALSPVSWLGAWLSK